MTASDNTEWAQIVSAAAGTLLGLFGSITDIIMSQKVDDEPDILKQAREAYPEAFGVVDELNERLATAGENLAQVIQERDELRRHLRAIHEKFLKVENAYLELGGTIYAGDVD